MKKKRRVSSFIYGLAHGLYITPLLVVTACAQAQLISQEDLLAKMEQKDQLLILDVRNTGEFEQAHIPGAINIPHNQLSSRIDELLPYRDKEIVTYCRSGSRVRLAIHTLKKAGFINLWHLKGDMKAWIKNQRKIERGKQTRPSSHNPVKPHTISPDTRIEKLEGEEK